MAESVFESLELFLQDYANFVAFINMYAANPELTSSLKWLQWIKGRINWYHGLRGINPNLSPLYWGCTPESSWGSKTFESESVNPWTIIARQAPLSMEFSREEYCSG